VSREQVECGVDIADAFGVDQPILALSAQAPGLMQKPPEVLADCLSISRLVSATDDDVQARPTPFAEIVAPPSNKGVQLVELDAHGELRGFESVRG
jgi:hypothetical protein